MSDPHLYSAAGWKSAGGEEADEPGAFDPADANPAVDAVTDMAHFSQSWDSQQEQHGNERVGEGQRTRGPTYKSKSLTPTPRDE